ncbi:proline--tRNA ligase [Hujiaoplasma nucleasis]|uniref:Proline--tRNA ligase n=1 Tax=Hujiaoplasma nucleasis TaxID=2725268 RepID=A0A7L6MZL4_9MOLU|nr:proline--tRNA ligase [Hujiaoplasma nucleasis]QLY39430.1 proline--tRNA ligase [Hujiaoplasma nucleasis]
MGKKKFVKAITSRDEDFAQWYTDVCLKAELMDYSDAKGFIIYRPYGYALWENMKNYLDAAFKRTGHENVYMPLVIPESLFLKEAEHVEGFAPETAIITMGGNEELQERLIIRPTSEVLFCNHYAKVIESHRDLPKKYNQWCSVVRWEKTTRPFLRGSEFLWQEGHTAHATEQEAREEALNMLDIYQDLGKNLLAIPFITGVKTDKEKFAGAVDTYTIEALMHDNKALQSGTTHYLGTGFAKAFDINFQDKDGELKNVYQTSWGVSTRLIGAVIMVHGDDSGLVLPPYLAPIQVDIIPIMSHVEGVMDKSLEIKESLEKLGIRVKLDDTDKSPGWKFSESEMRGTPLRIEVGPRDLENNQVVVVKRYNREKITYQIDQAISDIPNLLKNIHDAMYENALKNVEENTRVTNDYEEFKQIMQDKSGYVKMMWCGDETCEAQIKEETKATSRCMPFDQSPVGEKCPVCHKEAKHLVYFAKAY